eukprot:1454244-Rhodomonas_salina.5
MVTTFLYHKELDWEKAWRWKESSLVSFSNTVNPQKLASLTALPPDFPGHAPCKLCRVASPLFLRMHAVISGCFACDGVMEIE